MPHLSVKDTALARSSADHLKSLCLQIRFMLPARHVEVECLSIQRYRLTPSLCITFACVRRSIGLFCLPKTHLRIFPYRLCAKFGCGAVGRRIGDGLARAGMVSASVISQATLTSISPELVGFRVYRVKSFLHTFCS